MTVNKSERNEWVSERLRREREREREREGERESVYVCERERERERERGAEERYQINKSSAVYVEETDVVCYEVSVIFL